MSDAHAEANDDWVVALRQRRAALLQRMAVGTAAGLAFSPLIGWTWCLLWLSGYFLIQAMELRVFRSVYQGDAGGRDPLRDALGSLLLFFNTAFYGSLSIPLWFEGGPVGGVCAAIMLAGGAIYSTVNAPQSMRVLACTVAPHMLYLCATPLFLYLGGAPAAYVTAGAAAAIVFSLYCLTAWRKMNQVRRAEQHTRRELQREACAHAEAIQGRDAFVAAVGHDLRTPLSAILSGAETLENEARDASARANAALIAEAGRMMKAMLDDLLDHAKLGAGRMRVEEADFDLRTLLAHTLRLWQGPADAKGLRLRVEGARQIPAWVRGDAVRLRQVLNNLISNAMKFTPAGGVVTLRLRAWTDEIGAHALLLQVIDTGPGMTPEQMARLFTPFDQTTEGVSALHGGSGLGLAISRDLVSLMGGRLTVNSAPGQGAAFTLSLTLHRATTPARTGAGLDVGGRAAVAQPLAAPSRSPAAPEPASADADDRRDQNTGQNAGQNAGQDAGLGIDQRRPLRVLIVDDHEINRRAIQLILTPVDCDVAMAADGLAALAMCDASAYDVIFMDVRMPELDGRETTRRLRGRDGPNRMTPVIAVTADSSPEDIAACMAAGMTYFVSKPLTPPTLLGALSHVLEAEDETDASAPETASA